MESRNDLYVFDFGGTLTATPDEQMVKSTLYANMIKTGAMKQRSAIIDTLQERITEAILEHDERGISLDTFQMTEGAAAYLKMLLQNPDNKVCIIADKTTSEFVSAVLRHNDLTDAEINQITIVDSRAHQDNIVDAVMDVVADIQLQTNNSVSSAHVYSHSKERAEVISNTIDDFTRLDFTQAPTIKIETINAKPGKFNYAIDQANDSRMEIDESVVQPTKPPSPSRSGMFSHVSTSPQKSEKKVEARSEVDDKIAYHVARETLKEDLSGFIKLHQKHASPNGISVFKSTLEELKVETSGKDHQMKFITRMREQISKLAHEDPNLEVMKKEFIHVTNALLNYQNPANEPKFLSVRRELFATIKAKYPVADAKKMQEVLFSPAIKSEKDFMKTLDQMQKLFCKSKQSPLIPILDEAKEQLKTGVKVRPGH